MKKVVTIMLCMLLILSISAPSSAAETTSRTSDPTAEKVEIITKRDAYGKTYQLSDGSYQYVAYAQPIHYLDSTGNYVEIDNSVVASESGEYCFTNKANAWNTYFSEKISDTEAVVITSGNYSISFSFQGQPSSNSVKKATDFSVTTRNNSISKYSKKLYSDERAVVYSDVLENVDIAYTVKNGALKEDIIIKSRQATASFTFGLSTNGLILSEKNDILALHNTLGEEIFRFAPLYMEDANGKRSEAVYLSYTSVKNGYEITISVDPDFLNAADTVYPVVVDPSVMVTGSSVTYDTCVDQQYPTSNYYLSENLWTGGAYGTNAMRTYIKFEMPGGISGANVTSAYLNIKKKEYQPPTIKAYRVFENWSSSAITWNSKPSYNSPEASQAAVNTYGDWYQLDITAFVKQWLYGTAPNYGVVLKEPAESDSAQKTKFYSSDAPSPNKPELVINYNSSTPYFGPRPYQDTDSIGVNCMGYAVEYGQFISAEVLGITRYDLVGMTTSEMLDFIAKASEDWMDTIIGQENWNSISTYNSNINTGWYRAVLRVGFVDANRNGVYDANERCDYHWWYQTISGDWADKPGKLQSRYLSETANQNPVDLVWTNNGLEYNSSGEFYVLRDIRIVYW